MITALDRLIERSHGIRILGRHYHPYFIAADMAVAASLIAAYASIHHFGGISFLGFVAVYACILGLYRLFLLFKSRILKIHSRSFLQDTLLFVLPVYVLLSLVVGYPLRLALDLLGLILPIYGAVIRLGCFLGGCCYGVAWEKGVLYPDSIFQTVGGCRGYRPGVNPGHRVFPIQLAESSGLLLISALIASVLWSGRTPLGLGIPLFLLSYSVLRFFLDFFRRSSARPRKGPFSEAQIYCVIAALGSVALLASLLR